MQSQKTLLAVALAAGLGSLAVPAFADVYCPPNPGAVTIDDNVIVENGKCVLNGTQVKGNVLVKSNGALTVRDARIEGNIQADGGLYVHVESTKVDGDIQLEGVSGGDSYVKDSYIGGNLQLNNNRVSLLAEKNIIDGDLQAFSNISFPGDLVIYRNFIDGNLQCKSNDPKPIGGRNRVSGNKEDQCARL
jgi:cytoskeletal protein CcmA (bactofilin family)